MAVSRERVESALFPYLPITVPIGGLILSMTALLDTGFDGDVSLSPDFFAEGEEPVGYQTYRLADGSLVEAPYYNGVVQLGGFEPRSVSIVALGEDPVVGTGPIRRYRVTLDRGERVTVEV